MVFILVFYKRTALHTDKVTLQSSLIGSKTDFRISKLFTIGETNTGRIRAADINGDGTIDIVAGFQWFEGPEWIRHQYAQTEAGTKIDAGNTYTYDLDNDTDIDIVLARRRADGGRELIWFENPGGLTENIWKRHLISEDVSCVEEIVFIDIDHDGMIEMVTVDDCIEPGLLVYEIPSDPTHPWLNKKTIHKSKLHGLGIGDLNEDNRLDIVSDYQLFINKPDGSWVRHTLPSTLNGSSIIDNFAYRIKFAYQMMTSSETVLIKLKAAIRALFCKKQYLMNLQTIIYDIDGDGDNDILVTQAHTHGIYWLESSGGTLPEFILHKILSSPSQLHGVAYADIDNDGDIDIFTGKSGVIPIVIPEKMILWMFFGWNCKDKVTK